MYIFGKLTNGVHFLHSSGIIAESRISLQVGLGKQPVALQVRTKDGIHTAVNNKVFGGLPASVLVPIVLDVKLHVPVVSTVTIDGLQGIDFLRRVCLTTTSRGTKGTWY